MNENLPMQQRFMQDIMRRKPNLSDIADMAERIAKNFGDDSREYFIATFWNTYHVMNA